MNKIKKIWISFWGKKYRIIYSDNLKENEVLVYRHKVYLKKGVIVNECRNSKRGSNPFEF